MKRSLGLSFVPVLFTFGFAAPLGYTVRVPLDYSQPKLGSARIYYELGAPFDRRKPTVFVIADGQQFYLRKGAVAGIEKRQFDARFNVVGVVGRGDCPDAAKACKTKNGTVDWARAYRLFRASQWVGDIETVRRRLVGAGGKIMLYGQSGGAFLSHQYLEKYGAHVSRAVTPAAVMPFWLKRLGFKSDRFWEELPKTSQLECLAALRRFADRRPLVIQALQRQNFFVPVDKIEEARVELIHKLAEGDEAALAKATKDYQVDSLQDFMKQDVALPIRVRIFEFYEASGEGKYLVPGRVYPNLENSRNIAKPLSDLLRQGKIATPRYDFVAPHRVSTEVLVISGVRDHTVDYRSSIALAASYPRGAIVMLNDDHMFARAGSLNPAIRGFLLGGLQGSEYRQAIRKLSPILHREGQ